MCEKYSGGGGLSIGGKPSGGGGLSIGGKSSKGVEVFIDLKCIEGDRSLDGAQGFPSAKELSGLSS